MSVNPISNAQPSALLPRLHRDEPLRLSLPETIVQFGTGGFLRGFAEYFVEQANAGAKPIGRVVMVGSTGSGRVAHVNEQGGRYTLVTRGRAGGQIVDDARTIECLSRALSAADAWPDVLDLATSPDLRIIISNTTEVGIVHDPDDRPDLVPPRSFPGKLTAFLHHRATAFDYDPKHGLIILPCELLERNGDRLRDVVMRLSDDWNLGDAFCRWLEEGVVFCNTLVDRVVPGTPDPADADALAQRLGYRDDLLTVAEPFRFWAIEWPGQKEDFPFHGVDEGIVLTEDVGPYRERKVRILNGSHTIMVPAALLLGLRTVDEAVNDPLMGVFTRRVIFEEIVPSLDIDVDSATNFARDVIERFENPFLHHELWGISLQQTMKMRVRVVPSLRSFERKRGALPPSLTFGLAAFIEFKLRMAGDGHPRDDADAFWSALAAQKLDSERTAAVVLTHDELWDGQLSPIPGLPEAVSRDLASIRERGIKQALKDHLERVHSYE